MNYLSINYARLGECIHGSQRMNPSSFNDPWAFWRSWFWFIFHRSCIVCMDQFGLITCWSQRMSLHSCHLLVPCLIIKYQYCNSLSCAWSGIKAATNIRGFQRINPGWNLVDPLVVLFSITVRLTFADTLIILWVTAYRHLTTSAVYKNNLTAECKQIQVYLVFFS